MRAESALHPVSIRTVWPWFAFFLATSPLVLLTLPFALVAEWRRRKLSLLFLLAAVGLFANLLLLLNYSTAIGWRYLSTGMPALVPVTSYYMVKWLTTKFGNQRRGFITVTTAISLIAILSGVFLWSMRSSQVKVRTAAKDYDRELKSVPSNAVMISGAQTVAVIYWRGVGAGDWDVIGPGAGWPGPQTASVITSYLNQGRRVFIDTNPLWWQPCGWHVSEIEELARLETRFHFHQVAANIYEVRPVGDPQATDRPQLEILLPANRPDEVKRCFSSS